MLINSNDIFNQIGLAIDQNPRTARTLKPKYTVSLQIQLSEDEKHILEVRDSDDPSTIAYQFCHKNRLNKFAAAVVQAKIREAMQIEQQKYAKGQTKERTNSIRHNKSVSNLNKSQRKSQKRMSPDKSKYQKSSSRTPNRDKSRSGIQPIITDNIYLRSLVKLRMTEQKKTKIKVDLQKKQEESLTFKPQINTVSEKIIEFLRTNEIQKEKKASPPKKIYEEMKECTFKPKINKVSERIVNNKSILKQQREQYNKLYQNPNKKTGNKNPKEEFPFQPTINTKSSQKITLPFFKRLEITQEKKVNAMKRPYYDQEECSFQPKVGRAPLQARENENIWDHLHFISKKKETNVITTDIGNNQISKQTSTSKQYYDNLIEQRIKYVFETLDGNMDGVISPNEISIELLPPQCLYFLKPIFMEMDEVNAHLNFYDFKRAVHALLIDSDPGTKGGFLAGKWKKQIQERQTFHPTINRRSKQLSVHRSSQNLYKDGLKQKQNREYKLERERALKQQKQLAECSFKPLLSQSSKIYMQKISKKKKVLIERDDEEDGDNGNLGKVDGLDEE